MKYSFVFCFAALFVIQCSARPQQPPTASPPPETVMTDPETPSDVTEQVVFDEVPTQGGNQDESDSVPVTTDLPTNDESQTDDVTTISPAMMEEIVEANTEPAAAVPVSGSGSSQEATAADDSMPDSTTVSPPPSSD
ncbi:hypothetical protein Ocin01_01223 [Orchesella cincta]|uniref:Uncharacterized protein n=1 Tax=Orchesella cincta TaxID=48709 RepID=A0A1D2NJU6_ORCCI|nr:hypothetical protein Ocin01_01223 [Orchesella cincta]